MTGSFNNIVQLPTVNQPDLKKIGKEHGCILRGLSIYIELYNLEKNRRS